MAGGAGLNVWHLYTESGHVGVIDGRIFFCDGADFFACVGGGFDDFIVNIRNVGDICDLRIVRTKHPCKNIECHSHTGIADMGVVVNRGATGI